MWERASRMSTDLAGPVITVTSCCGARCAGIPSVGEAGSCACPHGQQGARGRPPVRDGQAPARSQVVRPHRIQSRMSISYRPPVGLLNSALRFWEMVQRVHVRQVTFHFFSLHQSQLSLSRSGGCPEALASDSLFCVSERLGSCQQKYPCKDGLWCASLRAGHLC
jgi:hypothetical protein